APELGGRVAVVIGAGSGIGKAVAARVAAGGAAVVCADLHGDQAAAVAESLEAKQGAGIGVAGTGLSAKGPAIALPVDITDESSVRAMVRDTVLAYGGIDAIIVTAGVFIAPDASGHAPFNYWSLSFAVNVTGSYLVATAARDVWEAQGLSGAMVLTTSVNGTVAGKGSVAYDTSKAAANHLVRELAVTFAPLVRVNGLAPATVVEGSAMFGRERVIASLTKYGIGFAEDESTDELRSKLADFYAQRTLTRQPITLADQAEVAYLLITDRFSKTTGQIINVDGGRSDAFLR
ncbi:MAG TPA: SDR family oxidoreductase, partial [Trueperaceae bacterium]|nr:SDR family oxidoreductase [Trueperaceae bacterium]